MISNEFATALTDILLCVGTFWLGVRLKTSKAQNTWRGFFFALAAAAGFGALYHGVERFHEPGFWVLVSAASLTGSFLFFAACSCISRPQWKWLTKLWPFYGLAGIVLGTLLSSTPFWVLTLVSAILIFVSIYLLQGAPSKESRQWIFMGIGITLAGFVVQKFTNFNGIISHNALFHEMQLIGNYFIYVGAKKA